jgi:hypothetical protein
MNNNKDIRVFFCSMKLIETAILNDNSIHSKVKNFILEIDYSTYGYDSNSYNMNEMELVSKKLLKIIDY